MEKKMLYLAVAAIIVVALVVLLYGTGVIGGGGQVGIAAYDNVPVSPALMAQLTSIPVSVANNVGIGSAEYKTEIHTISGAAPLNASGKPEILYMGAEYCPFCAAQRWALLIALSRFGNFSGVEYMTSSTSDYSPSTPTFTFVNATYTSSYLTFVHVEMTTNKEVNNTYPTLQKPTAQENALAAAYDTGGSIPFVDFGNQSALTGSTYDPLTIDSENWTTIASKLGNPSSLESQEIIGSANLMTAEICLATNEQPQSVCGQPYVSQIQALANKA